MREEISLVPGSSAKSKTRPMGRVRAGSRPDRAAPVIYPVPDPRLPLLGVHFTRRITGKVDAGPNPVLALEREGYGRANLSVRDLASSFTFPASGERWHNTAGATSAGATRLDRQC
jgi:L-2-hydroxyglutarate oxidase LhgO